MKISASEECHNKKGKKCKKNKKKQHKNSLLRVRDPSTIPIYYRHRLKSDRANANL